MFCYKLLSIFAYIFLSTTNPKFSSVLEQIKRALLKELFISSFVNFSKALVHNFAEKSIIPVIHFLIQQEIAFRSKCSWLQSYEFLFSLK